MNIQSNTNYNTNSLNIALLTIRVGAATLMLTHGIPKLLMLFSGDIQFPGVLGLSPFFSLVLAVFSEVLCSVLVFIGLKTRLATIPLIITMLVAVILIHHGDPFARKELGLLYLLLYVPLLMLGGGKFSLDALLQNNRN
ncbi:MAG TPA: DoxX family protein [Lutibacter sp.]